MKPYGHEALYHYSDGDKAALKAAGAPSRKAKLAGCSKTRRAHNKAARAAAKQTLRGDL